MQLTPTVYIQHVNTHYKVREIYTHNTPKNKCVKIQVPGRPSIHLHNFTIHRCVGRHCFLYLLVDCWHNTRVTARSSTMLGHAEGHCTLLLPGPFLALCLASPPPNADPAGCCARSAGIYGACLESHYLMAIETLVTCSVIEA